LECSQYTKVSFYGLLINLLGALPFGIVLLLYTCSDSFLDVFRALSLQPKTNFFPYFIESTFVLDLLLSALNPLQLPFWFTWNKMLDNKGILKASNGHNSFK